jgi:hypothetical protein
MSRKNLRLMLTPLLIRRLVSTLLLICLVHGVSRSHPS